MFPEHFQVTKMLKQIYNEANGTDKITVHLNFNVVTGRLIYISNVYIIHKLYYLLIRKCRVDNARLQSAA